VSIELSAAIVNRLCGQDYLLRTLSTYRNAPAIFTAASIPEDTAYPYVWSPSEYSSQDDDAKNAAVFTLHRDVNVYVRDEGTESVLDELAAAIRRALHKAPLRLGVDKNVVLNAAPPIVAPTADGVIGRLVQLRLLISEG
jgi:hypothetical protein